MTPDTPRALHATVIVPAYNAAATISDCVRAIQQQQLPPHITLDLIVVDDSSQDATAAAARALGAQVLTLPINQGRSAARNAGAHAAGGDILLFTDADCIPTPTWAAAMLAPFAGDPHVVGVKGAYLSNQRAPVARFTQLELEEKYAVMARQATISFIDTYAAAYRRSIFLAAGGFDASLSYSYIEDQEFSFRLAAAGHKMVFAPAARVYHHHVTAARVYYRRKFKIGMWKTIVLRRYPQRMAADSRTPLTLKLQFGLAIGLTLLLPLALVSGRARRLLWLLLAAFGATTLPFLRLAQQRDPALLPWVLPLLLLRACGLGHGYVLGLVRLRGRR